MMKVRKQQEMPVSDPGQEELLEYLRNVRFRKRVIGVDETELWAVLGRIQRYYEECDRERSVKARAEEACLRSLLEQKDQEILSLKRKLVLALRGGAREHSN